MIVSVRFSSVSPTSLASSMSFSSERRVRSSRRASAAFSPLETSARRSSRPASRLVDEPLFLEWVEVNPANFQRNRDTRPRHFPLRANVLFLLRLGRVVQLHRLLQRQFIE